MKIEPPDKHHHGDEKQEDGTQDPGVAETKLSLNLVKQILCDNASCVNDNFSLIVG